MAALSDLQATFILVRTVYCRLMERGITPLASQAD